MNNDNHTLAEQLVQRCLALGADEASVSVSSSTHVHITRRDGQVEQATEATTRGLGVAVLVGDRFSSSSTSDLRSDALEAFTERCVEAASYLEADPARRQPDASECGRGASVAQLDQDDPAWDERSSEDRLRDVEDLEGAIRSRSASNVISHGTFVADGRSEVTRVFSNGFSDTDKGAWFAVGGDCTLTDGEKRPEAGVHFGARYLADIPDVNAIAQTLRERADERIGARPIESGSYPMILDARAAGRILGMLGGPLAGASLHQERSCLKDKHGERIGSDVFSIHDEPGLPRGLGSRPWDGDGRVAKAFPVIENGVLKNFYIGQYYARKLDRPATTGGRSNWVIPAGDASWQEIAKGWPKAIRVTGFLGGNSNSTSGDFSFGIQGQLIEHGEATQPLAEMNVAGNLLTLFHSLVACADDPWAWSAVRSPTLLFEDVQFSGA
jgi:PmbA protein